MSQLRRALVLVACFAGVLAIGVVDFFSGPLPDLTVLYLIPIGVATAILGLGWAIAVTALTTITEVVPPLIFGDQPTGIVLLDGGMHLLVRGLGVFLIDRVLNQLREIRQLKATRDFDLELAARAQQTLFAEPPHPSDLVVGLRSGFLREVGGDYYHFAETPRGPFFCIGDISGKGTSAALFTAVLDRAVEEAVGRSDDMGVVIQRVNARMLSALPTDRFVTLCACLVTDSCIEYANAGHEPPLLYRHDGERIELLSDVSSVPLGIMADIAVAPVRVDFARRDVLLLTTDGVTDSPGFMGRAEERLREILSTEAPAGAQRVADAVFDAVHEDGVQPRDDVVVLAVERP